MPTQNVPKGKVAAHGLALTANVVTTVTFADNIGSVDVISDGVAALYYTVDGSTPTVGGSNAYLLPAGAMGIDTRGTINAAGIDVVNLISAGTPTVSVQRGDT